MRKKRMDKGMLQEELATLFGTSVDTITNWENNRCVPQIQFSAKIISFLGYDPFQKEIITLGDRIKAYRVNQGLSHRKFAKLVGVDGTTISSWERNENAPQARRLKQLMPFL